MDNTNDRVQLKQEEVVGSEVVLKDINPKTSSKSVDDSSTGVSLDKTIERIWNAINNKLSRIVNSVNGRTGVVVLNSEDVGLGNVDNVSFADIKEWVINKLKQEFGNKRIRLYDDMAGLAQDIALNDESIRDSAFYCDHQDENERRACIGYIYWDEGESRLSYMAKYINTIGSTDNSIIYNEKLGTVENGDVRDYTGGKIGVNIYKGEEVLELYNGGNKNESGLRINQSKLGGKLVFFDGVYGNGSTDDDTALLYFDASKTPSDAKRVNIYIDDVSIGSYAIRRTDLNVGDIVQCNFAGDEYIQDDGYSIPSGMAPLLMYRHPAIGRVTQAPSLKNPNQMYIIEFHTIRPNLGWGLEYLLNHKAQNVVGTPTKSSPSELTMKLTQGTTDGSGSNMGNVSGLQVYKGDSDPDVNGVGSSNKLKDAARYTVLPQGPVKVYDSTNTEFAGGLSITPDMSLCVMPVRRYSSSTSIVQSCNWKLKSPMDLSEIRDMSVSSGTLMDMSLLGINLMKVVDNASPLKFSNASGLRISSPIDNDNVSAEWFGMTDTEYSEYLESIGNPDVVNNSGGLSVNVGKFLEISPSVFTEEGDYYDGGKVNVRIGWGLIEDTHSTNKIMVNIGKGLNFTGLVGDKKINVGVDKGLEIDNNTNKLNVKLGKLSVFVDEHTGLPFTKESREMSQGLKFDDSSGVSVNIGKSNTAYNKKGLMVYPDPEYDADIIYGYLYEGEFYKNETHSSSGKYTPDTSKIYIDLTNPIQTAYKYDNPSKTYVKTLLNGILGVDCDSNGGLGLRGGSGSLYARITGGGLKYSPKVQKYEYGKTYMNGDIVVVDIESTTEVNSPTHNGVYILDLNQYATNDLEKYNKIISGYLLRDNTGFIREGDSISESTIIKTPNSSTLYIDIGTHKYYVGVSGKFTQLANSGYLINGSFYEDPEDTSTKITGVAGLYYIDAPTNEVYKWMDGNFVSADQNPIYYKAQGTKFDIGQVGNSDIIFKKYIKNANFLYPNIDGTITLGDGTKIMSPTSDTIKELDYNNQTTFCSYIGDTYRQKGTTADGYAIFGKCSDVNPYYGYYKFIADKTGAIGVDLPPSGCLQLKIPADYEGYINANKTNFYVNSTATGTTYPNEFGKIYLDKKSQISYVWTGTSTGFSEAFDKSDEYEYGDIMLQTGPGLRINSRRLQLAFDTTYFEINDNGNLTLNTTDTGKKAWKDYLGISST